MTDTTQHSGVSGESRVWIEPQRLCDEVASLFQCAGLSGSAAQIVAKALVDADRAEMPSHGVMLVPMYLQRLKSRSVGFEEHGELVRDVDGALVLDAHHCLGQLSSAQCIRLLRDRASTYGIVAVAVRNAFHFGAAGYWASQLAEAGLIGIAMSNTGPLMPAPGGAQRVVGNNPLAIAMPAAPGGPAVVDMALSASAMGKIRLAAAKGDAIPNGWAADAQGRATTDPQQAINGMLLPAAGPKGFGLAFMVDLFCGALSSGAIGADVQRLYGNFEVPYGCAHFFLAIDVERFLPLSEFMARAGSFAEVVRASVTAEGVERVFSPGDRAWGNRKRHAAACPVDANTVRNLKAVAAGLGQNPEAMFQTT